MDDHYKLDFNNFKMGFVELWSLGASNTYFALKNWKRDITKDYKVTSQEQQFHGDHYDAVRKNNRIKILTIKINF